MARSQWFAFSGILQRQLSSETEIVTGTQFEVVNTLGQTRVLATFETQSEAQTFVNNFIPSFQRRFLQIREVQSTVTNPAQSRAVAVVPLTPLPVFARPGKVLTTRGFWDVTSVTVPAGIVSNFAFGMIFMPVKLVYDVIPEEGGQVFRYDFQADVGEYFPDPLLDDPGFFCYDSFVRVVTDVNQDPPFHSKTKKKFPAHSVLCVIAGVEVIVPNLKSLTLNFGIRFRVLIED